MRSIFLSLFGLAVGWAVFLAGAAVRQWSDADKIDYVYLPTVAVLLPYAAGLSVVLIVLGNGWLRAGDSPSGSANSRNTNSNTKEGSRAGSHSQEA